MCRRATSALLCVYVGIAAMLVFAACPPAFAVRAGFAIDVNQDCNLPLDKMPDGIHIEGRVCSNGRAPVLLEHLDDVIVTLGGYFEHKITKLVPENPSDCWYLFEADWGYSQPDEFVPYCLILHLGLLFDVDSANTVTDVVGWWTRDGRKLAGPGIDLTNEGYCPLAGFNVAEMPDLGQVMRVANGVVVGPPPMPGAPIPIRVIAMDVVAFPPGPAPDFRQMFQGGGQDTWPWIPVLGGNGEKISPENPVDLAAESFFDVFLDMPQPKQPAPAERVSVPPGGFLVARTLLRFRNNSGNTEDRWEWEVHGAPIVQACCLPDGTCQDLLREDCLRRGGNPQGEGRMCATWQCPDLWDFGDAPDRAYQTLLATDGARHLIDPGIHLGDAIDSESDGQPNAGASGDDEAGWTPQDEDGVKLVTALKPGNGAEVNVVASAKGYLSAWVDFNIDGQWDDPGEKVFTNIMLGPGENPLTFLVPPGAKTGDTYARFRFSREDGLRPFGEARDGEVEDYLFRIEELPILDYGDAPATYPTTLASDGARHKVTPNLTLGPLIDAEPDGLPSPDATGDDVTGLRDEDGVSVAPVVPGATVSVTVRASAPGMLDAWLDFNDDGDWNDRFEQIFASQPVVAGANALAFTAPVLAPMPGSSIARFRLSTAGGLSCTGLADDGEVEDHAVTILENPDRGITIGEAKLLPVNSTVLLKNKIVTADFRALSLSLGFAIEESSRSAGVTVLPGEDLVLGPLAFGDVVSVVGVTGFKGAELTAVAQEAVVSGHLLTPLLPLRMTNKATGGQAFGQQMAVVDDGTVVPRKLANGLNNVGSLVRTWGRVTCVEAASGTTTVWIDDGCALRDWKLLTPGSAVYGMVVLWPSGATLPAVGDYVGATGVLKVISRGSPGNSYAARALVPRDEHDVTILIGPL